jgi:hypothetical protein
MASVALVLSIVFPSVGNYWYGLTALSPAAYIYYMSRAERVEQVSQQHRGAHVLQMAQTCQQGYSDKGPLCT